MNKLVASMYLLLGGFSIGYNLIAHTYATLAVIGGLFCVLQGLTVLFIDRIEQDGDKK